MDQPRRAGFILSATVFLIPLVFLPGAFDPFAGPQLLFLLLMSLLCLLGWLLSGLSRGALTLVWHRAMVPGAVFLLFLAVSFAVLALGEGRHNSLAMAQALGGTLWWLANLVLFAAAALVFHRNPALRPMLPRALLGSGLLLAVMAILQYAGYFFEDWPMVGDDRVYATLGSPNLLGAHLAFAFPLGLSYSVASLGRETGARRLKTLGWLLITGLLAVALFLTQTRSALLAATASSVAVLALLGQRPGEDPTSQGWKLKTALLAGVILAVSILAALRLIGLLGWGGWEVRLAQRQASVSLQQRFLQWRAAWNIAVAHPLTGAGPGFFKSRFPAAQAALLTRDRYIQIPPIANTDHAHQDLLEVAADLGFGGALIFSLFLLTVLLDGARAGRGSPGPAGVAGGLAGFLVFSAANFPFYVPSLAATFWVSAGWLLSFSPQTAGRTSELPWLKKGMLRRPLTAALVISGILGLVHLVRIAEADRVLGQGVAASRRGQWDKALPFMESAAKWNPWDSDTRFFLGTAYRETGKPEEALAQYSLIAGVAPNQDDVWDNTGAAYYAWAQYKRFALNDVKGQADFLGKACEAYDRALALEPRAARIRNNYGAALADLGRLEEALAQFKKALEIEPNMPDAYNGMGNVLDILKRPREAVAAWEKAISLRQDFLEPYYNLAILYHRQHKEQEARRLMKRTLEIAPDFQPAKDYLETGQKAKGKRED